MELALPFADLTALAAVAAGLFLGGILKGATGAGSPVIAVPVIAAVLDVPAAVALMVIPNLVANLAQMRKYRHHAIEPGFARNFALAGMVGAGFGTVALASLPLSALQWLMAGIIVSYIVLRLARPALQMPLALARRLSWAAGIGGGILQGAVGVSAPVAVTFLNAMRLDRPTYIFTISVFFAAMCVSQFPLQMAYGLMTPQIALLGALGLIPLFAALPIGEWIGTRISPKIFDRVILVFLAILALRIIAVELS